VKSPKRILLSFDQLKKIFFKLISSAHHEYSTYLTLENNEKVQTFETRKIENSKKNFEKFCRNRFFLVNE
jgi:hypothetical protein